MGNPRKRKLKKLARMKKRNAPSAAEVTPEPVPEVTPAAVLDPVAEETPVVAKPAPAPKRATRARKTTKTVKTDD